jgi:predicted anti-sigma-YlaC factor YlaD
MRCTRSRRLLGRDLDGRLVPAEAERLAAHLASCERCRAERAAVAGAWAQLEALEPVPAVPEDWPVISTRLAARTERRPWLRWPLAVRRAIGAGAIAGLAVVGLLIGDRVADAALGPARSPSLEAVAIAEGFGDLPFGAPSPGLLLAGNGASR